MRATRVDRNHGEIVDALRKIGCSVQSLATIGDGCPDLLVYSSAMGELMLMEVKDGTKPPSARALTADQCRWHSGWRGAVYIVTSVDEALALVGAVREGA